MTSAYHQFRDRLLQTRSLIKLGVVGIDQELEKRINPLLDKFADSKGARGRKPKRQEPLVKQKRLDDGSMELDERTAFYLKRLLERHRKRHEQLRYFHYANLSVAIWAAFETYNAMLFEELYRVRPELLKSSEQLSVKDALENRDSILDFLIERQLESIGHLKLKEVVEYYKKRLGVEISETRGKKLETYYFLRNVLAHKTGLIRSVQKLKSASADFHIVGDEIRISKTFLIRMARLIEATVKSLETQVNRKFYAKRSNASLKPPRSGLRPPLAV